MEFNLHSALKNREFELYLQPQVALQTGKLSGAEALVRWNHPTRGILYPNAFVPAMEQSGAIVELDFFMLEEACALLARWHGRGMESVPLSVNQSPIHVDKRNYLSRVEAVLHRWNTDPQELIFEFTEEVLCAVPKEMRLAAAHLRALGIRLAMDDFGTGYASLSQLKDAAVDIVKLDKSFLASTWRQERDGIVLRKTMELLQELGVATLCEGVEHREQENLLRALGCDFAQGYLYGHAMPVAEFELQHIKTGDFPILARM